MRDYDPRDEQELDALLQQVDDLLVEPDPEEPDIDQYAPDLSDDDGPMFFQNYSNDYGRQVRNYQNGYGGQEVYREPEPKAPASPIYNADFRTPRREKKPRPEPEYRDYDVPKKEKKPRKKRGCGCLPMLAAAIVLVVAGFFWLFDRPESDVPIGDRKSDTAVILLCGTDISGDRTDTMMLLYLSGSEDRMGLLSLPRDSYTITASGSAAKLNAAYARNGKGAEGMEGLLDYVQEIIGYRPDGYMLVSMELVENVADSMGGVDMEVPMDMEVDGISLNEGFQHLDGEQILTLLRYRAGYWNADLGRVQMQRQVLSQCLEQWLSPEKLFSGVGAMGDVMKNSTTDLSARNLLWIAKTMLGCMGDLRSDTLPGNPDYYDSYGVNYVKLYPDQVAELINDGYNPYQVVITADDLKIAG